MRFRRGDAVVKGEEATLIRRKRYERRKIQAEKILESARPVSAVQVLRGAQVPTSLAEAKFKARAVEKGWRPHRPSWPDFLVETAKGLIAVEVKSRRDSVSRAQRQTFGLLEAAGIPVYLWRDAKESEGHLVRWEKGLGLIKVGLA
jgi:hypothetical protein